MRFFHLVSNRYIRSKKSTFRNLNSLILFKKSPSKYPVTPSFKLGVAANGFIQIQHKGNILQTRFESCLLRDILRQLNLKDWTGVTIRNVKATKTEILTYNAKQRQWLYSTKNEGLFN